MINIICSIIFIWNCNSFLSVRNNRIVDLEGGEMIFHGLNVVVKVPPYIYNFTQQDMAWFQQRGINGLRLGVMWPGVQSSQGNFNQTYLKQVQDIVQLAGKYNIYTLVQFHQDIFSEKFCADGVPVWAIPQAVSSSFSRPLSSKKYTFDNVTGMPLQSDCAKHYWGTYYFSEAVNKAFYSIWTNKHNLRDKFIRYWQKVAENFKNSKYVIAYELMNEPWPGNIYTNPSLLVPGLSEITHMQEAYDLISEGIRKIDPNHNICFEPVTWLNNFRSGFTHPPGGFKYSNNSIFCYHFYKPPSFSFKSFMNARVKDFHRLKSGGLLSQFLVLDDIGEANIEMMNLCDQNLQSWFGWIYNHGSTEYIKGIVRTYAQRVAGTTIQQSYNPQTKQFRLTYYICPSCGDTIIFVSQKYIYQKGYDIECIPKNKVQYIVEQYYVKIRSTNAAQKQKVMITISAL